MKGMEINVSNMSKCQVKDKLLVERQNTDLKRIYVMKPVALLYTEIQPSHSPPKRLLYRQPERLFYRQSEQSPFTNHFSAARRPYS